MYIVKEVNTGRTLTSENIAFTTSGKLIILNDVTNQYEYLDQDKFILKDYPIPSKEQFRKIINEIYDLDEKYGKLNDVIYEVGIDSSLWLPTLKDTILNYFVEVFDDQSDLIFYFICDIEYGKSCKKGMVTYNGKEVILKTVDDLYDVLVENLK